MPWQWIIFYAFRLLRSFNFEKQFQFSYSQFIANKWLSTQILIFFYDFQAINFYRLLYRPIRKCMKILHVKFFDLIVAKLFIYLVGSSPKFDDAFENFHTNHINVPYFFSQKNMILPYAQKIFHANFLISSRVLSFFFLGYSTIYQNVEIYQQL